MNIHNFHDVEQLSALLDGKLSPTEAARLESRLRGDPDLQSILNDLTQTRGLLRRLPRRKAPRNFTLTPQMAGVKPPTPRAVPALRFATLLATFLLVFSFATNGLVPALRQAAQAPAYGMGGSGGGNAEDTAPMLMSEAATELPAATLLPPAAAAAPMTTLVPTLAAEDGARELVPTPEPFLKTAQPPAEAAPAPALEPSPAPIPAAWQIGLLVIALLCAGAAWLISRASERSWRAKTK